MAAAQADARQGGVMSAPHSKSASTAQPPTRGLILLLSVATGLSVGTQYYNQPLLGLIADAFHTGADASLVSTATQIGYALGLVLLVPLGDRIDRRRLILLQCFGLILAMASASVAPGLYSLAFASVLVGIFATIAQQIIPLASELASTDSRERIVAVVTSALLIGVLLSRTVSGFVGAWFGWRAMFVLGAALVLLMLLGLAARLPRSRPASREPYVELLLSLFVLVRDERELRRASLTQSLLFFGFSAFWTILTLLLQGQKFQLTSSAAGMFGVFALVGVVVAPYGVRMAGESAGRIGAGLVTASFILMIALVNLVGLVIGAVLMIAGLQISLISNQSRILAAAGSARGRYNTVFMASQFSFGAAGSSAASFAWRTGGWTAVMAMAAAASVAALALQIGRRHKSRLDAQMASSTHQEFTTQEKQK